MAQGNPNHDDSNTNPGSHGDGTYRGFVLGYYFGWWRAHESASGSDFPGTNLLSTYAATLQMLRRINHRSVSFPRRSTLRERDSAPRFDYSTVSCRIAQSSCWVCDKPKRMHVRHTQADSRRNQGGPRSARHSTVTLG